MAVNRKYVSDISQCKHLPRHLDLSLQVPSRRVCKGRTGSAWVVRVDVGKQERTRREAHRRTNRRKVDVTAPIACGISTAFGTGTGLWLDMQKHWKQYHDER